VNLRPDDGRQRGRAPREGAGRRSFAAYFFGNNFLAPRVGKLYTRTIISSNAAEKEVKEMKSIIVALSVLAILAFAVVVSAQVNPPTKENEVQKANPTGEQSNITQTQPAPAGQSAPAATKPKHKAPPTMFGTVVSVDSATSTLVVKTKKGDETFTVDPKAKIMMGKKTVKLTELPKDTNVSVMYATEGANKIAKHIMEMPKMTAKKTMTPKPEAKPETKTEAKPVTP
jgi:hypothetical protein